MKQQKKEKQYITVLMAAKELGLYVSTEQRYRFGVLFFDKYRELRKVDRKKYPWIGKAKEGKFMVRAYPLNVKKRLLRNLKRYLEINNKVS